VGRRARVKVKLAAVAVIRLRLMDTPQTLDSVLRGIDRWLESGWQHARRLPCGPMIRVPRNFWMYHAKDRHYPYVGHLTWDRELAKLTEVFAQDPYTRGASRDLA
jgi:hypothetical protein